MSTPLGRISLLVALSLLISACVHKPPVPEEKFVDFYIHLQIIDTQFGTDSTRQAQKVDSLMKAFQMDKKLFDSTMAWYERKPELWEKFFAEVKRRLAQIKPEYVRPTRR